MPSQSPVYKGMVYRIVEYIQTCHRHIAVYSTKKQQTFFLFSEADVLEFIEKIGIISGGG